MADKTKMQATSEDFAKIDIRVGKIISAEPFPEAIKPAYKIRIDFGTEVGEKNSSVRITEHYRLDELAGKLVLGVVNFPPKQIGPFLSEVLTLGLADEQDHCILAVPDKKEVEPGSRLY